MSLLGEDQVGTCEGVRVMPRQLPAHLAPLTPGWCTAPAQHHINNHLAPGSQTWAKWNVSHNGQFYSLMPSFCLT